MNETATSKGQMSSEAATKPKPRPRRSRRKLNTPLNLALAAILIALVAFWLGGMLQDDSSGSSTPAMPFSGTDGPSGMPGQSGGSGTRGEITSLEGNTLYVSTDDGATVKVKVKRNATVTRNAKAKAGQLHPGDSVTVSGKADDAGVVRAESVTATQSGVQAAMPDFGGAMPEGMPAAPGS
jgi:hypothetical protein